MDTTEFFRAFFDKAEDYIKSDSIPMLVLHLAKYQYQNAFAADPEINLTACLTDQFQQQVRAMCGLLPGRTDLLSPVVMVNLLGDVWKEDGGEPNWDVLAEAPNAQLHLYGKKQARPGRKMGHFNVMAATADEALEQAQALKDTL